jgi:predicted DCC family thiol-disulfide oxidoreductase YuxK
VIKVPDNLILFDGVCNLCSALVQFVIRHDREAKFRFAAIQSEIGRKIYQSHGLDPADLQTFVFIADGKVVLRSDAAIEVVSRFGGAWRIFAIFRLVPRVARDFVYSTIARNRYRWFGRKEVCMIPTPEIDERFLG